MSAADVVVVGNGAAGTLVVIDLVRGDAAGGTPLRITWVGDGPTAHGVAYATKRPWHRLNVPADTLSLDAAHQDFPSWLEARGVDAEATSARDAEFAPRWSFGAYLAETLRDVRAAADPSLVTVDVESTRAVGAVTGTDGVRVELADGRTVDAGHLVLAPGPFPSPRLPGLTDAGAEHPGLVVDPWSGALESDDRPADSVVLVGTGLTMVDAALSLGRRDPRTRLLAVSRSGLLPRAHSWRRGEPVDPPVSPGMSLAEVVRAVQDRVARAPDRWRDVVDGLRPAVQDIWRSFPAADRDRFLAEHARTWEVHRHRMAPSVADELGRLRDTGRLEVRAASVTRIDAAGDGLAVTFAGPDDAEETVHADRVVSCIGAQEDVTAVDDPLVAALVRVGDARPHPTGLGFDTDDDGALVPVDGRARRVFTLGTTRRGDLYETTAVPEIREQAAALAGVLLRNRSPQPSSVGR
ncbi:FAD/NAD(P)-binding protein [Actinomycetospora sp. TBRC 11914]|uniref:FAD/NAD(P)-binding protein n=1 Tax=Actinomycetospora sp. TBRC 11914 TaxID=2729387 RepID=UPI00145C49A9|nr:FAD/NAD(P)-binding protein [Actinomycetospora sp. TBRC 11914]NMO91493.1 FAD-dependent oxidoreductase [Actinomycetospora sp. TBRC 11914]